jgi:type I restriction enzyme S subunit
MEVKLRYTQSEAGLIPQDWESYNMLQLTCQIMDYRGRTPKKLGMEWGGGEIPALSAGNVKKGYIDFSEECYFGSDKLYRQWMTKGDVAKDDILFTTEAPLGNVALVPDNRRYILSQRTILLRVRPQLVSSTFLFQMLLSEGFQRILADYSTGSTAKGIQRKKFELLSVALPPLPEQQAVAKALCNIDDLITTLDRLIAKKRDIKQATMQQLLTGRIRLPGFSGKWEVKKLGDVGAFHKGCGVKKDEARSGDLPCVRYGEIYTHHNDYVRVFNSWISREVAETATLLRQGDIMFAGSGETKEEIGKCVAFVDNVEAYAGGDIVILRPTCADSLFLGYLLNTPEVSSQKASRGQGDAVVHISSSALASISLSLPQLAEQTAIASMLFEMDAELSALEARRDKTRNLKQGMMQELLTGKTRLT